MKKQKMISKCCVCHKIKRKEGFIYTDRKHMDFWGYHHEDIKELQKEYDIVHSHGYCPECYKKAIEDINSLILM